MAKQAPTSALPCLRVKIGDKSRSTNRTENGCAVIGSTGISVGEIALRPETKFTAKNVQGGRGETCGTTTVKSGKNKGKVRSKPCPKPCGLIKPPVDKNGKKLTQRCPVQLAYDQGQPFLRFCTKKDKQGYRVDVASPADAMEKATKLCGEWEAKKKKFSFAKGHPLAGSR